MAEPSEPATAPTETLGGATPAPTPVEIQRKPRELTPVDQLSVDDVQPSSFEGVTPGETTVMRLIELLGEPKSRTPQEGAVSHLYTIGPFPHVQFFAVGEVVRSILVHLKEPIATEAIVKDLTLNAFEPAPVVSDAGAIIGQVYPERGVVLAFAENAPEKVIQIVLEPIASHAFVRRALHDGRHQYTRNLQDLNYALKINPADADAYWLRSRVLARLQDLPAAVADIERAVQIAPNDARYLLTRARLLGETGKHDEAIRETQSLASRKDVTPIMQAKATLQLGDLLSHGPAHDYKLGIERHMEAIRIAKELGDGKTGAVDPAARQVLLDAHLAAAHDIAAGRWRTKKEVVSTWLKNARAIADAIAEDSADAYVQLMVDCESLAAYSACGEQIEIGEIVDRMLLTGRELLAAAEDPLYQQCLEWELGEALVHAASMEHRRGDQAAALMYAENADALLASQVEQNRLSPTSRYLVGKLWFLIGANHAVFKEDHREAIDWYTRALPMLTPPLPTRYSHQLGASGEQLVSIGVSFWLADERDKAIELTRQGLALMKHAVRTQDLDSNALAVPYNNLASMYRQLGDTNNASGYAEAARQVRLAKQPGKPR